MRQCETWKDSPYDLLGFSLIEEKRTGRQVLLVREFRLEVEIRKSLTEIMVLKIVRMSGLINLKRKQLTIEEQQTQNLCK
jgi:hypothetical protein